MIHINLLPVKAAQKKEQLRNQLIVFFVAIIAVVCSCYFAYSGLQSDLQQIETEIAQNNAELRSLQKKIGEVNRFKKLKSDLQNKLDVLESLKRAKSGPVRLMDDLISALPEKLWITDFKSSGRNIEIKGIGLSEEDVAQSLLPHHLKLILSVMK
jgi:type IV pilus assembly protein PilN